MYLVQSREDSPGIPSHHRVCHPVSFPDLCKRFRSSIMLMLRLCACADRLPVIQDALSPIPGVLSGSSIATHRLQLCLTGHQSSYDGPGTSTLSIGDWIGAFGVVCGSRT